MTFGPSRVPFDLEKIVVFCYFAELVVVAVVIAQEVVVVTVVFVLVKVAVAVVVVVVAVAMLAAMTLPEILHQ